jgi:hypothetical protein
MAMLTNKKKKKKKKNIAPIEKQQSQKIQTTIAKNNR